MSKRKLGKKHDHTTVWTDEGWKAAEEQAGFSADLGLCSDSISSYLAFLVKEDRVKLLALEAS